MDTWTLKSGLNPFKIDKIENKFKKFSKIGYPLVNIKIVSKNNAFIVKISQSKFYLNGYNVFNNYSEKSTQTWFIPVTLKTKKSSTFNLHWLKPNETQSKLFKKIIFFYLI
jgi:hypothetical protein